MLLCAHLVSHYSVYWQMRYIVTITQFKEYETCVLRFLSCFYVLQNDWLPILYEVLELNIKMHLREVSLWMQ